MQRVQAGVRAILWLAFCALAGTAFPALAQSAAVAHFSILNDGGSLSPRTISFGQVVTQGAVLLSGMLYLSYRKLWKDQH